MCYVYVRPFHSKTDVLGAYFLISKSFCQLGNTRFNQLRARQMIGSPKNPKPMENVVIFMNMADVVRSEIATAGASTAASRYRGTSCGKGGVGERAL